MKSLKFAGLLLVAALGFSGTGPTLAQSLTKPSKSDLIRIFAVPRESLSKSFRPVRKADIVQCGGGETAEGAKNGGRVAKTLEAVGVGTPSVNLDIAFKYDSDELSGDARTVLDEVGLALADTSLQASRFVLTGHTDAKGSEEYNFLLSCARAVAARNYLEKRHNVARDRLVLRGAGFSQLLDTANPENPVNRRVELRKADD